MGKKLATIVTAVTLTSLVGCAITNKVFPDALDNSLSKIDTLFSSAYSEDTPSSNDNLKKSYFVNPSEFNKNIGDSNIFNLSLDDLDSIVNIKLSTQSIYNSTSINKAVTPPKAIEIDMRDSVKSLRRLPKEKFYFEHRDQFDKDSLALVDIINSIDLYTEVVSKELVMAMINHESHFFLNPGVSWAGARGPAQITIDGWNTVEEDKYFPNVNNPERNILAGVKISLWLENYCEKNYKGWNKSSLQRKRDLIVAGYNCGIGTLTAYGDFQRAKKDSSFVVTRHPYYISETPKETRDHVVKVRNTLNYLLAQKTDAKKFLAYNKP